MAMGARRLNQAERAEIWRRWHKAEPLCEIAKALGREQTSVGDEITRHGGIAPRPRRRNARHLSLAEREEISRGVCLGERGAQIARRLGRSGSTISRELRRCGTKAQYRAERADRDAWQQACRPKPCRLAESVQLRTWVAEKLQQQWSPEQIATALKMTFPDDQTMRVSAETIYRSLYVQARGALKKELLQHLRLQHRVRRSRQSLSPKAKRRGQIVEAISISERPAEVADRAVPGHWEGDLLIGTHSSQIATLVERHSRFVMLLKVPARDTQTVVRALRKRILTLPEQLRRSLTWDRGLELAAHKQFTLDTKVQVYFCDPHSPWQRGSNENTNGLLRQYFPKGKALGGYSQAYLDSIALRLNTRPRKTLGFITPAQKFAQCVALTD
jgi:IS30 family transposase